MDRIIVRFARFLAPGSFVANAWTTPVESLDPNSVAWPEHAYAFTLHERIDIHDGPDKFTGAEHQVGPMYYHPDSKVKTLAEVKADTASTRILISNMECNGWDSLIYSRWGSWPQPFDATKHCILG